MKKSAITFSVVATLAMQFLIYIYLANVSSELAAVSEQMQAVSVQMRNDAKGVRVSQAPFLFSELRSVSSELGIVKGRLERPIRVVVVEPE